MAAKRRLYGLLKQLQAADGKRIILKNCIFVFEFKRAAGANIGTRRLHYYRNSIVNVS